MKKLPFKSIQNWSYILIIAFFVLSYVHPIFGLLGLLCMITPIVISLMGYGKAHCTSLCPRGSFFGVWLSRISLNKKLPKWLVSKTTRNIILVVMMVNFTISVINAFPNFQLMGSNLARMMMVSFIVGIAFGTVFKSRAWCAVCPMGYTTELITKMKNKKVA